MRPVRLTAHALARLDHRGCTEAEVVDAVRRGSRAVAAQGRFDSTLHIAGDFAWRGGTYRRKTVRPVFVEEATETVVVTVYVYFGDKVQG